MLAVVFSYLNMEWNGLGWSECCAKIGEALQACTLRMLILSRCRLSAAGAALIGNGLSRSKHLEFLVVDGNNIAQAGARSLFKAKVECNSRRETGKEPLKISSNECNIETREASGFDPSEPGGLYTLDMRHAYDRHILLELMRLVANEKGVFVGNAEIDERYDGSFQSYRGLVVESKVEDDWWIPETGILSFTFGHCRIAASQDDSLGATDLEWRALKDDLLDPDKSSKDWLGMIQAQISGDTFLHFEHAAELLESIESFGNVKDRSSVASMRIEVVKQCYNRLVEPDKNEDLLNMLSHAERSVIEKYLGSVARYFCQNNPTGQYCINLGSKPERDVFLRLIELYNSQQQFINNSKIWYSTRAGGARPQLERCWRNPLYNGQPHTFLTSWTVPAHGIYQVDFVQVVKPSPDSLIPTQRDLDELKLIINMESDEQIRLRKIRSWSNNRENFFLCDYVDQLLDFFHEESSRVELFVIAFSKTVDWHGYKNLLEHLNLAEYHELNKRITSVNLFDEIVAVGYYELNIAIPDDRFIAQELLHLAIIEPGENIVDCQYNGADMDVPAGWAKQLPEKGLLSFNYCREKECISEVMSHGAYKQDGNPYCVNNVIPPAHR
jgi:hypothetical protein